MRSISEFASGISLSKESWMACLKSESALPNERRRTVKAVITRVFVAMRFFGKRRSKRS